MTNEMKVVLENSYMGKEIIQYIEKLEESEESLAKYLEEANDIRYKWRKKCNELEKALDKACDELESYDYEANLRPGCYAPDEYKSSKQWKEWCLKDG